jgi:hypothetical protein
MSSIAREHVDQGSQEFCHATDTGPIGSLASLPSPSWPRPFPVRAAARILVALRMGHRVAGSTARQVGRTAAADVSAGHSANGSDDQRHNDSSAGGKL